MGATPASEWTSKTRKEVTCPSGNVAVVRKLTQRDYMPKSLIGLRIEKGQLDEAAVREYLKDHYEEILDVEDKVLVRGVVSPVIALVEGSDGLYVRDLDPADRSFLLDQIAEWSGLSEEQQGAVNLFRSEVRNVAGGDGKILRETPERVGGPAS